MALDERGFFTERPEQRVARYTCPKCRRVNDYQVRWVRRTKKDRLPPGADESDRAKFSKLRDHLIRVDDEVVCKSCQRKFEIPSMHSMMFLDQLEGLPQVDDEDDDDLPGASRPDTSAPAPPAQARPAQPPAAGQGRPPQQPPPSRGPQQPGQRPPQGQPPPRAPQQGQGQPHARGPQPPHGQGRPPQHGSRGPQGPGQRGPGGQGPGRERDGNRAPQGQQGPGDNRPPQVRRGPPRARGWFQGE